MLKLTQYMLIIIIVHSFLPVSGLTTGKKMTTACVLSNKDIDFTFDLQNEAFAQKSWFVNTTATRIAQQVGTGPFVIDPGYSGRVSQFGSAGITLSSVSAADSGEYLLVIYASPSASFDTATTTLSAFVGANTSCTPSCDNDENNPRCKIPEACPAAKGSVQAVWTVDNVKYTNEFECTWKNYLKTYSACAEGNAVTACYSEKPLCIESRCRDRRTTVVIIICVIGGSCIIVLIILFCCGCLDCCSLCRKHPHYKKAKQPYVTFYCRQKGCLEWFFCKGRKQEKGICCCFGKKGLENQGEDVTSKGNDTRQPSFLCCFCICCARGQEEKDAVHLQKKWPQAMHRGTQNKVKSENSSDQANTSDQRQPLPSLSRQLEEKSKSRSQLPPPGNTDAKDRSFRGLSANYDDTTGLATDMPRSNKLPPLLAAKQPTVEEEVDLGEPKKRKKKEQ